jgi:hypothetical protein
MPRFSGTRRNPSISRFGSVIEGGNLEIVYPGSTASGDLGLLLLSAVDMEGGSRRYGRAAAVGFVKGPSPDEFLFAYPYREAAKSPTVTAMTSQRARMQKTR